MENDNFNVVFEVVKVDSPLWLLENHDFVVSCLEQIKRSKDVHTVDEVYKTILRMLPNPDFASFVELRDGELVGFASIYVSRDIYDGLHGEVWLLWSGNRCKVSYLDKAVCDWFKSKGVTSLGAVDVDYTPAKSRWFKRLGFVESYRVFEREI